eukprot:15455843-Alexandrium_andersonii.AAC.1
MPMTPEKALFHALVRRRLHTITAYTAMARFAHDKDPNSTMSALIFRRTCLLSSSSAASTP